MNEKISRNDPCPCGSRKKYKKCCGANDAISITHLIESEIEDMQKQILHYAFYHFGEDIHGDFEELEETIQMDDEKEKELYLLIHAIWFTLFEHVRNEETILDQFILTEGRKIKRPRLKQILQSWSRARTIAGTVVNYENNKLTIRDGFTSEQFDVMIPNQEFSIENGIFLLGMLLPYEQNYVFFPSLFDYPGVQPDQAFEFITERSFASGYDSPQTFLTDFFMELMNELPLVGVTVEIDEMEWPAPVFKEVAEILKKKLELLEEPAPIIDLGIVLWYEFCQIKKKRIKNPNVYAAALHYLVSKITPMDELYTQKELAEDYGVSTSAFTAVYREMEAALSKEISELIGTIEESGKEYLF